MEHLQYVIEDSTIAYLLGVNNFTNDESAILELVKNSYDAGALHVNISFSGDQLVIDATDPAFASDIRVWCERTGNTFLNQSANKGIFSWRMILSKSTHGE